MHFLRCVISCLAIVGVVVPPAFALDAEKENPAWVGGLSPVEDSGVTSVNIDVFVRRKDDSPVVGLTRDQFRVFQDNVEIPITSFSAFTQESLVRKRPHPELDETTINTAEETATHAEEANPIYIVLYIDNANLRRMDRNRVLRPMERFSESVLAGPVHIMVVSHDQSVNIVQPFTDVPREVVHALRYLRTTETLLEDYEREHSDIQRAIRRSIKNRNKTSGARNQVVSELFDKIRLFADQEEARLAQNLQAIHEIGTTLTGINGRKYLVYVSNGLPLVVSKDLLHEFSGLDARMSSVSLSIPFNKRRYYDSLAATANAQEITIHAIDATGPFSISASIGDSESPKSTQAATVAHENHLVPLRGLTKKTGGLAVINEDDFDAGFNRIKADLMTYYSIGYDIETSGKDKVHSIDVTLDDDAGHELRFRRAFIEKSLKSKIQERVNASLFFAIDDNPMGLVVTPGAQKPATTDRWMKPFTISIPIHSLALVADGDDYVGKAIVFVATRDFEGRSTDIQRRNHEFTVPVSDYEKRRDEHFFVDLNLLLKKGRHQMVVGVFDETTRRASYQKMEATIYD
ncbi:MAG: VWA domain-containing protein [Thermoanaerobaculales bacterium]|nr:VWA domain-containing protein [Thermoanaerobaculales bacterium]